MRNIALFVIHLSFVTGNLYSQLAPNFTITDSDGTTHELYEDYLDKGITVAIKFFFVDCPPCNAIAPHIQTLYEDWGEGAFDVQFLELSDKSWDNNTDVAEYKTLHSLTFPGVGQDGGSLDAVQPYKDETWGDWKGTPSFAVIAPDRSVVYNTGGAGTSGRIANLDAAIAATGAIGDPANQALPAVFNFSFIDPFGNTIDGVEIFISDSDEPAVSYPITGQNLSITSLQDQFPGITNPVLSFHKAGTAVQQISPLDMLLLRKHILSIIPITDPALQIAADDNGDGTISPLDMLILRKLILTIITDFPVETYSFLPAELPISILAGQTQDIEVKAIKIGDLNGF